MLNPIYVTFATVCATGISFPATGLPIKLSKYTNLLKTIEGDVIKRIVLFISSSIAKTDFATSELLFRNGWKSLWIMYLYFLMSEVPFFQLFQSKSPLVENSTPGHPAI